MSDMVDQNIKLRAWNFDSNFRVIVGRANSHTINRGYLCFSQHCRVLLFSVSDILSNFMARIFNEIFVSMNIFGAGVSNQTVD